MIRSKRPLLLNRFFVLVAFLQPGLALAAPWLPPGDARARHAVQSLADRGHLNRNVTTWPMMWADVSADQFRLPSYLSQAASYLNFERLEQGQRSFRAEFEFSGSSQTDFTSGFSNRRYEEGGAHLNVQWQGDAFAAGLAVTHVVNPEDGESRRYDGSYLAGVAGNWVLGAGLIDRWWGPGWQSSLILSNNARPVPSVWASRKESFASENVWLRWLGPWNLTFFAGQMESERVVSKPGLLGMRFTLRPLAGLDIGLSRSIMVGGEGRPDDITTIRNALIGRDNTRPGEGSDPGNQLASIDVRYGFSLADHSMSLYAQTMGEDESGALPSRKSWLFGSDWTSRFSGRDQQWFVEYVNTMTDDLFGSGLPNVTYSHSIYITGYHFFGRSLGASFESDAEVVTFGFWDFYPNGHNAGFALSKARLNQQGGIATVVVDRSVAYQEPVAAQNLTELSFQYQLPALGGWVNIEARLADDKVFILSGEHKHWSLEAAWRYRF